MEIRKYFLNEKMQLKNIYFFANVFNKHSNYNVNGY